MPTTKEPGSSGTTATTGTTTRAASNPTVEASLKRLENMMLCFDTKLDDNVKKINASTDEKIAALKQDIKEDLLTKINANEAAITDHNQRINQLEDDIATLKDALEKSAKANDLIIKGIPILPNEQPRPLYLKIATAIGYCLETTPPADAFRLGKRRVGAKFDPPLMIRFTNFLDRDGFLKNYFRHKTLNLLDLGYQVNKRVFITENLTRNNQLIYAAAMKMKFDKKICSVSTVNGSISIKKVKEDRPTIIQNLTELNDF
jgi:hypothetical protein